MEDTINDQQQLLTKDQRGNLFKRYWFVILLAFIATILAIVKLIFLPDEKPQELPKQAQESWRGIIAGKSTKQDVLKALGEPASTTADSSVLFYEKPDSEQYHEVFLENQKVSLIKNKIVAGHISDYKDKYGEPEGEFYGPDDSAGYKLYVYSTNGVAVLAHTISGRILEIWYFPPMLIQQFLAKWREKESLSGTQTPEGY